MKRCTYEKYFPKVVIEEHEGFYVVRDDSHDLLEVVVKYKRRFVGHFNMNLIREEMSEGKANEFVYGGSSYSLVSHKNNMLKQVRYVNNIGMCTSDVNYTSSKILH